VVVIVAMLVLGGVFALRAAEDEAAQTASNDPCALVTHEEMAEHVGHDDLLGRGGPPPPGAIPPISMTGMRFCKFERGEKAQFVYTGLTPAGADSTYARELFETWRKAKEDSAEAEVESVPDLGVEAVWVEPSTLVVRAERQVFGFVLEMCGNRFGADSGERERAIRLAEKVLARDLRPVYDESEDDSQGSDGDQDADGAEAEQVCSATKAAPKQSPTDEAENGAEDPQDPQGDAGASEASETPSTEGEGDEDENDGAES
jgi:hypothetical protein